MIGAAFKINKLDFSRQVAIAPLITFRIVFGLLMLLSTLRFWWLGWIDTVYVIPKFHFTYWGFSWVHSLGTVGMHSLFFGIAASALCILLGLYYRLASLLFFCCFSYVELIDVTTYLNHYYFISLVAFLMIWLPANRAFSLDVLRKPNLKKEMIPAWCIGILRFQMAVVYVFAGIAKLNPDWILDALPMRIWLPAKSHLPIVGSLMYETCVAYLFSWFGAVYDLFIAFLLLNKNTRPIAYIFVMAFHIATVIFFPGIGMFPYVMMTCSLVFFSAHWHEKLLGRLPFYIKSFQNFPTQNSALYYPKQKMITAVLIVYIVFQLAIPFRYLLYPKGLFWHEEGYRLSWRVMLMEKSGVSFFKIKDPKTHKTIDVNNAAFLTPVQEKMMSTQPDLILQYAHLLAKFYKTKNIAEPIVTAEIYVSLNGTHSQLFIDSSVNLAAEKLSWRHFDWVIPIEKQN